MLIAAAIILTLALWAHLLWLKIMSDAEPRPSTSMVRTALGLAAIFFIGRCVAIFLAGGLGWTVVAIELDILVFALLANGSSLPWPFWIIWLAFLIIGVKLI